MALTTYQPLSNYQPWAVMRQLQRELSNAFEDGDESVVTTGWIPAVDIREDKERFVIRADVPGVDPKNIDVSMENGILSIRGERSEISDIDSGEWHRIERTSGQFYRRFALPDSADADHIEAHSTNGVLEIVIPKQERVKPRKIAVDVK